LQALIVESRSGPDLARRVRRPRP